MSQQTLSANIIQSRVGKTPLVRARNLEKELGLKNIFVKLEGNNPSGHREDRLSRLLIRDALEVDKQTLCVGSYGVMAESIAFLSSYYDVNCVFIFPEGSSLNNKEIFEKDNIKIIYHGQTDKEALDYSNQISKEKNWYNANPGIENNVLNMTALSYITNELNNQIKEDITTVFSQMSYGYSITGLHLGFRRLWIDEEINKIPMLYSCTTDSGNTIFESYKKDSYKILPLDEKDLELDQYNMRLVNLKSSVAQDALSAIHDTNGKITGVSNDELKKYVDKFKSLENIELGYENGYSIAAFMKEAKEGHLTKGNHVILLNDGRTNLELKEMTRQDNVDEEKIIKLIDQWLMDYTDPKIEIREALTNALDEGFVVFAYHNNVFEGIAVITSFGFEHFASKYHLAYIATNDNVRGRGIATELLSKAIELSKGNLSLHVDIDNDRAIKLYEKMGFTSSYIRMMYQLDGDE